jgi:hypothetical protein
LRQAGFVHERRVNAGRRNMDGRRFAVVVIQEMDRRWSVRGAI